MNTNKRDALIKKVEPVLATIGDEPIRNLARKILSDVPEYIWYVPASSTGKYHPKYSLGEGGLMRHQIAVVKFLNYFFELEQYQNMFTPIERDCMRVAGLVHDCMKSGTEEEFVKSKYTKFNHPVLMAEFVLKYKGKVKGVEDSSVEFISNCIKTHMGQWNLDQRTGDMLEKPGDKYQRMIHLADYLASRKELVVTGIEYEYNGEVVEGGNNGESAKFGSGENNGDSGKDKDTLETYVLTFGKHSGEKLIDVWKRDRSYCDWMVKNITRQPVKKFLEELAKGK